MTVGELLEALNALVERGEVSERDPVTVWEYDELEEGPKGCVRVEEVGIVGTLGAHKKVVFIYG